MAKRLIFNMATTAILDFVKFVRSVLTRRCSLLKDDALLP